MKFPFKQKNRGGLLIREFSADVDSRELVWHRDRRDRKITVKNGSGWMIQFENKLPQNLVEGQTYSIKKNVYHRIIRGNSGLILEIKEF